MALTVHCDIVSAEEEIFSGLVELVVATGSLGDLGITPGHTPLLTELMPGPIRLILEGGGEEVFYLSGGFLEAQPSLVKVLADTAMRAGDMSEASAREAKRQAEKELCNQGGEFDYSKAAIKLAEATAQLRTLQVIGKKKVKNKK